MSVGPLGMIGSSAGSPLAQSQGTDVNRAQQETASQSRQTQMSEKAEQAAGVGQTEQDEQASDRDADGRRPWESPAGAAEAEASDSATAADDTARHSKDPTGQCGNQLDLSG